MITHNGHKIISSKGLKKGHSASDALKRRQQLRDELERRQLARELGISHKEIPHGR